MPIKTKVADDTSGNYSFSISVNITRDSVEKITLRDENYTEVEDTSINYSFASSVDFTRNLVDQIRMRDESYPVEQIGFLDKDIYN